MCFLVTLAVIYHVFATIYVQSLLLNACLFAIGRLENPRAAPVAMCWEHTLILLCLAAVSLCIFQLATLSLFTTTLLSRREFFGFLGSVIFHCALIKRKGFGSNNNNNKCDAMQFNSPRTTLSYYQSYVICTTIYLLEGSQGLHASVEAFQNKAFRAEIEVTNVTAISRNWRSGSKNFGF